MKETMARKNLQCQPHCHRLRPLQLRKWNCQQRQQLNTPLTGSLRRNPSMNQAEDHIFQHFEPLYFHQNHPEHIYKIIIHILIYIHATVKYYHYLDRLFFSMLISVINTIFLFSPIDSDRWVASMHNHNNKVIYRNGSHLLQNFIWGRLLITTSRRLDMQNHVKHLIIIK